MESCCFSEAQSCSTNTKWQLPLLLDHHPGLFFFVLFFYLTGAEAKGWRPDSEEKISAYRLSFPMPINEKRLQWTHYHNVGLPVGCSWWISASSLSAIRRFMEICYFIFLSFQASNLWESCSICIWALLEVWSLFLKAPSSFKNAPNLCVNMLTSPTPLK